METTEFVEHVRLERECRSIVTSRQLKLRKDFAALTKHAPLEIFLKLHAMELQEPIVAGERFDQLKATRQWKEWKETGTIIDRRAS